MGSKIFFCSIWRVYHTNHLFFCKKTFFTTACTFYMPGVARFEPFSFRVSYVCSGSLSYIFKYVVAIHSICLFQRKKVLLAIGLCCVNGPWHISQGPCINCITRRRCFSVAVLGKKMERNFFLENSGCSNRNAGCGSSMVLACA